MKNDKVIQEIIQRNKEQSPIEKMARSTGLNPDEQIA